MKKLYQKEWHKIPFKSFTKVSSSKMPNNEFYASFYKLFFRKYKTWNELDPEWIKFKLQTAELVAKKIEIKKAIKILSIGCGIGVIEKKLIEKGFNNLEVTEVSKEPLLWLNSHVSNNNIHIGIFPECLHSHRLYDFIYLAGIAYCFNKNDLVNLLKNVKKYLIPGGTCLLIGYAVEFNKDTIISKINYFIKNIFLFILDKINIKKRGQLWGFIRNKKDLYVAMKKAGFKQINEGPLDKITKWNTFWIEGFNK